MSIITAFRQDRRVGLELLITGPDSKSFDKRLTVLAELTDVLQAKLVGAAVQKQSNEPLLTHGLAAGVLCVGAVAGIKVMATVVVTLWGILSGWNFLTDRSDVVDCVNNF